MYASSTLNRLKPILMVLIGALIVLVIIPISLWGTDFFAQYMAFLTPFFSLFTSCLLIYTAWWSHKNHKATFNPFLVLSLSMVMYSVASFSYFIFKDFTSVLYSFSVSDIFYMMAYPLLLLGLLLFFKKPFKIRYKYLLDAVIIMVAAFFIVWFMIIWPVVEPSQPDTISMIISIAYLFLDLVVLLTVLTLLFNENRKISELPLVLFSLGMFIQIWGDMVYAYHTLNPLLIYQWLSTVFYSFNLAFISAAVVAYLKGIHIDIRYLISSYEKSVSRGWVSYLPLVLVLFAYGLLIITTPDTALIWGVGIIVFLVIIRQIISLNEIKRNQEQISQKKEQLSFITSNMMDLITESDENGILRYVSPSSRQISGYDPEYLMGRSVLDFIHPDDVGKLIQSREESVVSGSAVRIRYRSKNAQGEFRWLESLGKPIFNDGDLKGFIYSTRDVTEQKKADEMVKNSLAEKETLLKEIHHRVNNNLQIIISLLNLQSHSVENENDHELFVNSQNRVRSMAMIHEKLYQSHNLSSINFSDYLKTLLSSLIYSYSQNLSRVDLDLDVGEVELNIETSVPCGLIINELVSNSLQHAFPEGGEGKITVKMQQDGDRYVLIVGDNGQGYKGLSHQGNNSLGLQLVNSLVDQLDGTMEMLNGKGTVYKIIFHELKYNERL